ncbi:MAG: 23S rRNA (guanosine(2251)-2'-O)-methyltransferase RlmB [Egibacteraceae bacterium]
MTHAIAGRRAVAEALRAGRRLHEVVLAEATDPLAETARASGVPVRLRQRAELDRLARGVLHQGVVAVAPPFPYRTLEELKDADLVVVLDGVTDPQNLGAIARSAELAGAGGLVLRERRSVHVTTAAEKASAGALSWLPVALVPNIARALGDLQSAGLWTVGLDVDGERDLWSSSLFDGRLALVVGAEGAGLSRLVAARVDALVAVPTRGHIGSLNASVAAAIALFEIVRRRHVGLVNLDHET